MEGLKLLEQQEAVFKQCLDAVVNGPFIPDWEFHILFGLEKNEVNAILVQWPEVNHHDNQVQLAINNSLNNLIGYPIDDEERWSEYIAVSKEELIELFEEWRQNSGKKTTEPKTHLILITLNSLF